ncbi:hypothetical protein BJ508DRAFT_330685 [Ascobolus immersus RN42]|uniref:Uncharacterized protein n=1 Tax=Ascobolus immersus RN42 TaxID=1160509 RepID=A0A3N4HUH1_ASCIM|nr:hypothetical protein BJ508DRAFT_330685 [Ascobolus immersus RN42]
MPHTSPTFTLNILTGDITWLWHSGDALNTVYDVRTVYPPAKWTNRKRYRLQDPEFKDEWTAVFSLPFADGRFVMEMLEEWYSSDMQTVGMRIEIFDISMQKGSGKQKQHTFFIPMDAMEWETLNWFGVRLDVKFEKQLYLQSDSPITSLTSDGFTERKIVESYRFYLSAYAEAEPIPIDPTKDHVGAVAIVPIDSTVFAEGTANSISTRLLSSPIVNDSKNESPRSPRRQRLPSFLKNIRRSCRIFKIALYPADNNSASTSTMSTPQPAAALASPLPDNLQHPAQILHGPDGRLGSYPQEVRDYQPAPNTAIPGLAAVPNTNPRKRKVLICLNALWGHLYAAFPRDLVDDFQRRLRTASQPGWENLTIYHPDQIPLSSYFFQWVDTTVGRNLVPLTTMNRFKSTQHTAILTALQDGTLKAVPRKRDHVWAEFTRQWSSFWDCIEPRQADRNAPMSLEESSGEKGGVEKVFGAEEEFGAEEKFGSEEEFGLEEEFDAQEELGAQLDGAEAVGTEELGLEVDGEEAAGEEAAGAETVGAEAVGVDQIGVEDERVAIEQTFAAVWRDFMDVDRLEELCAEQEVIREGIETGEEQLRAEGMVCGKDGLESLEQGEEDLGVGSLEGVLFGEGDGAVGPMGHYDAWAIHQVDLHAEGTEAQVLRFLWYEEAEKRWRMRGPPAMMLEKVEVVIDGFGEGTVIEDGLAEAEEIEEMIVRTSIADLVIGWQGWDASVFPTGDFSSFPSEVPEDPTEFFDEECAFFEEFLL